MKQLTKEQQRLVENNHNLIYQYVIDNKLSFEEHYGILAIGLCRASQIYDAQRGSFSTIAYKCMQNQMNKYWRTLSKQSAIPNEMIQYCDITQDDNEDIKSFKHKLIGANSTCDEVVDNMMKNAFIQTLTDRERQIINFLLRGFTHEKIAKKLMCGRRNVTYLVKQIRNKWVKYNK